MYGDKKLVSIQVRARLCIVENSDPVWRSKLAAGKLREVWPLGKFLWGGVYALRDGLDLAKRYVWERRVMRNR